MMLFLAAIICAILLIVWFGFFREQALPSPYVAPAGSTSKIKIDWGTLENPELEALKTFKSISPFEGEIGRENPLTPY